MNNASVAEDDPASASVRNEVRLTIENSLGTFEVRATSHLSHRFCRVNTTVHHDNELIYEDIWTR